MKKVILVAGARPNFTKIAPILRAASSTCSFESILVHTGQHYDDIMSGSFFSTLGIKNPDYNLQVGSGSHARQTADIMLGFEEVCLHEKPDLVVVVGDVNSTIAAGLVAKKLHIRLAHIEAGLRSHDRSMPEEINRLATDSISDLFFTTEPQADENLLKEGHNQEQIYFVGNVMIDNLYYQLEKLEASNISPQIAQLKEALPQQYICLTLHRPSNVDNHAPLAKIFEALAVVGSRIPIIFPCHPRTNHNINQFGLTNYLKKLNSEQDLNNGVISVDPLPYNEFLYLWKDASVILTDSGGLQEETTALNVPCLTIRENTERPITISKGSNVLVGQDMELLINEVEKAVTGKGKKGTVPDLWDGQASERIVNIINKNI